MNYKKTIDTAALAGKILLESNAESYRIEDVMNRILDTSGLEETEAIALATGLVATLGDPSIKSITVTKRITNRVTNLSKIARVNSICRDLTAGKITVYEGYDLLKMIYETQYPLWLKDLSTTMIPAFFALLLGGGIFEFIISWVNGWILVFTSKVEKKIDVGFFTHNVIYTCIMVFFTTLIRKSLFGNINSDIIITSSIFPILPGTAITNAFRDTLRGDYMSAGAKAIEAVVIALSVAIGVALGLILSGGVSP